MPIDDEELIRTLKAAAADGTAGLGYSRSVPRVWSSSARWRAVSLAAAAAVAAVAVGGVRLAPEDRYAGVATSPALPRTTAGGWVADNDVALSTALDNADRLRPRPEKDGFPFQAISPAGPEAPYPLLMAFDLAVPASATPYRALEGYEGAVLGAWVAEAPELGAVVWLRYPDFTVRISASYFETGEELARYLRDHPEH